MSRTKFTICSAALLMIGADSISSFTDSTRESTLSSAIYETTRDELLQTYPWRFSINLVALNRLVDVPLYGYDYAYQLPTNYLRLIGKELKGVKHSINEDKLYCNATSLNVSYQFTPDESKFPPYFVRLLEYKLAEIFSIAVLEDEGKSDSYKKKFDIQLNKARTIDAQSHGNHEIPSSKYSLINVRL